MKFNELKVGRKLQIYAFFVLLIFISGGLMALNSVGRLSGYIEHTYTDNVAPAVTISGILEQLLEHRIALRGHILSSSQEEMKKLRSEMAKIQAEVIALTEAKDKYHLTGEEEYLFIAFANNMKPLFDGSQEALQLSESFSKEDADKKMLTENPVFERSKEALLKLIKMKEDDVKADYETSLSFKKTTWLMTTLIIFGGLGIVIISSIFITRSIRGSISTAVNTVSTSATQIAATITQHERTASQQAASVSEMSATIDELGSSASQVSMQAESSATQTEEVLKLAEEGTVQIDRAGNSVAALKNKVGQMADQILRWSEQNEQISAIANLVGDIANTTNLLALNAAVEAARAGEHGKGFAVISSEIRKLADESKKSVERISALISEIQKTANTTVMVTEEGSKIIEEVAGLAKQSSDLMIKIATSAEVAKQSSHQITLNVKQQASAINQVVEAIKSINAGAKETHAGIGQTKTGIKTISESLNRIGQII